MVSALSAKKTFLMIITKKKTSNISYISNFRKSMKFSYLLMKASVCSLVNAFMPFLFKSTAHKTSLRVVLEVLNSKKEAKNGIKK